MLLCLMLFILISVYFLISSIILYNISDVIDSFVNKINNPNMENRILVFVLFLVMCPIYFRKDLWTMLKFRKSYSKLELDRLSQTVYDAHEREKDNKIL